MSAKNTPDLQTPEIISIKAVPESKPEPEIPDCGKAVSYSGTAGSGPNMYDLTTLLIIDPLRSLHSFCILN